MRIERDLHSNSLDYFEQGLELALVADENGNHRVEKSDLKNKLKWKLAIIYIVQSLELLCKHVLKCINRKLVFKDIDGPEGKFNETINLVIAYERIVNFTKFESDNDNNNKKLINKAVKYRNNYIHYDVSLYSTEIKVVFCKLIKLYENIYTQLIDVFPSKYNSNSRYQNFHHFTNYNMTFFRDEEVPKKQIEEFKKEIEENKKHDFYYADGVKYRRIKFGEESEILGIQDEVSIHNQEYCDDCSAKQGEYHLPYCDLEVCPKCHGQMLSCGCFEEYYKPFDTNKYS